ncbi:MAG: hypothetical protein ACI9M9_001025 [Flavobacteriaceae bacterium]|jgi:hypothetical protein
MLKKLLLVGFVICYTSSIYSQDSIIKIVEEKVSNRLMLYALNETDIDYDVTIIVEGVGFRQSSAKPRVTRVPATSKVNIARLSLIKGKFLDYSYKLVVNDSLSRRALRRQAKLIKVKPKKQITVYIPENCMSCDSIMKPLKDGKYLFTSYSLGEKPEIKKQLGMPMSQIDSLQTPLFSLAGLIYPKVKNYDQLLEKLLEE